jgi:uncharacterized protein YkwD
MKACVRILAVVAAISTGLPAAPPPLARDMLAAHNAVRRQVGVPPLSWSDRLAAAAQEWANVLLKRMEFRRNPRTRYGENLWEIVGDKGTPKEVVDDWASEAKDYRYSSNTCHGICGHYTQIVWRNTRQVGCAVARGGGREVWVCEYDPPGNYVGQRPY